MNLRWCFLLAFALVLLPFSVLCSQPKGRYQSAVIVDRQGLLCVGVSNTRESRKYRPQISVVRLYEDVAGREIPIWRQAYTPDEGLPTVSPDDCLAHDVLAENPFPEFAVGMRYVATIAAGIHMKDGRSESRYYRGYFCMVERDGERHVHQVLFNRRRGEWAWDACSAS